MSVRTRLAALTATLLAAAAPAQPPADPAAFHAVGKGDVSRTLVERGSLEADARADVACLVRARGKPAAATLRWIVDDGSVVKKGDLIATLDDAALKELERELTVKVEQVKLAVVQAEEDKKTVVAQSEAELKSAADRADVAELELQRLGQPDPAVKRRLEIKLAQAEAALEIAKERAATPGAPAGSAAAVRIAQGDVELAKMDLEKAQKGDELALRLAKVKAEEAKTVRRLAERQAVARSSQADARVAAAKAALAAEAARLDEARDDVNRCRIIAPSDGLAVYAIPEAVRWSPTVAPAVGDGIREGQRLMYIVDTGGKLHVRVKVSETVVASVRPGQKVRIRVDAFPNAMVTGSVRSVAPLASAQDWMTADVKVYPAVVGIDAAPAGLKPGMTAQVEILVEERKNVVRVPVQAVVREGKAQYCFVRGADGGLVRAKVTLGISDGVYHEVTDGLKEGDPVLLNPKAVRPARGGAQGVAAPAVIVRSVKPDAAEGARRGFVSAYGLTSMDCKRLAELPGVEKLVAARVFRQSTHHLDRSSPARLVATTTDYADVRRLRVEFGRFLIDSDEAEATNVVVLGYSVADWLFPDSDAVGQTVRLGSHYFRVVGVLAHDEAARTSNDVYIPLATCRSRFGETIYDRTPGTRSAEKVEISEAILAVSGDEKLEGVTAAVTALLEQSRPRKDWRVTTYHASLAD
jgi:HlyD family secretion protein